MINKETPDPLVSVVMPVRNGEKTLSEAIDSILAQTLTDFELIVIDDKSTDGTAQILEAYQAKDRRIRVFSNFGSGVSEAANTGLMKARAPYYARMDCDDIADRKRLELQYKHLRENSDIVLAGSFCYTFGKTISGKTPIQMPLTDKDLRRSIRYLPTFAHPTITVSANALRQIGGYRKIFDGAEDHDMYLRISRLGKLGMVPEYLLCYRVHEEQISNVKLLECVFSSVAAVYSDMCVSQGKPDPVDLGVGTREMAFRLVETLSNNPQMFPKEKAKLFVRALKAISTHDEYSGKATIHRNMAIRNLLSSGNLKQAFRIWRKTRRLSCS